MNLQQVASIRRKTGFALAVRFQNGDGTELFRPLTQQTSEEYRREYDQAASAAMGETVGTKQSASTGTRLLPAEETVPAFLKTGWRPAPVDVRLFTGEVVHRKKADQSLKIRIRGRRRDMKQRTWKSWRTDQHI